MSFAAIRTKSLLASAALLTALATGPARAQQPSQDQLNAVRQSCRSDFMANCSGVQPGGKDALDCLKRNLSKLTGACKTAVGALTPGPAEPIQAAPALAPAAKATPPAAPAPTKPRPPVTASPAPAPAAPVPPPAATAPPDQGVVVLPPREALRILRLCAPDQRTLCAGVPPGGGRIIACLMRNMPALSPLCRGALSQSRI